MRADQAYAECSKLCFEDARKQLGEIETTKDIGDQYQKLGAAWGLTSAAIVFAAKAKAANPPKEK